MGNTHPGDAGAREGFTARCGEVHTHTHTHIDDGHACLTPVLGFLRLELLLQRANKIQNMALDCEEKLTLAKNTLQAVSTDHHTSSSLGFRLGKLWSKCGVMWWTVVECGGVFCRVFMCSGSLQTHFLFFVHLSDSAPTQTSDVFDFTVSACIFCT